MSDALEKNQSNDYNQIIHASCGGTATAINYMANFQPDNIKLLFLESIVAYGPAAMHRSVTNDFGKRYMNFPTSSYLIPHFAYWRGVSSHSAIGDQPIVSASNIKKELPIVLVQSQEDDRYIPKEGANAIYYAFCKRSQYVYFIRPTGKKHLNILYSAKDTTDNQKYKDIVDTILYTHKLSSIKPAKDVDLKEYQPDPTAFKNDYDKYSQMDSAQRNWHWLSKIAGPTLYFAPNVLFGTLAGLAAGYYLTKRK